MWALDTGRRKVDKISMSNIEIFENKMHINYAETRIRQEHGNETSGDAIATTGFAHKTMIINCFYINNL